MCSGKFEIPKWHIETNEYGNYLVFDGDEAFQDQVLKILEKNQIGVQRSAASHRPADDGYQYDWFVRLENGGTNEECVAQIAEAFSDATGHSLDSETGSLIAERLEYVITTLSHTYERLLESRQKEVEELGEKLQNEVDDSIRKEKRFREEKKKLRARLREKSNEVETGAMDELVAEYAAKEIESDERVRALQEEKKGADRSLRELQKRVDDAEGKVSELKAKIRVSENGKSNNAKARFKGDSLIKAILSESFPRLAVDEDSLTHITNSFPKPAALIKILKRLDENDSALRIKKCKGKGKNISKVKEVDDHIHTGKSSAADMGRIYLREGVNGREFTVFVRIKTNKEEQSREIRRIANMNLSNASGFD